MESTCTKYQEDISAYVDKQLDSARQAEIETHLAHCQKCGVQLRGIQALSTLLRYPVADELIPDLWSGLSATLPSVCEVMQEDLSAYIDGELSMQAVEGVNQHLTDCRDCLAKFKLLNSTNQLLTKGLTLPDEVTLDLWSAVKVHLNEDCELIQSEISAFVDQQVPSQRHRVITSHLMDCPVCRGSFDQVSLVGEFIRNSYQPQIPENFDLWMQIKSKMQVVPLVPKAKLRPKIMSQRLYLVGSAAVVVGLVGSLAFLFISPQNDSGIKPVSAETYLLDSALNEPADSAEAVVYGNQ